MSGARFSGRTALVTGAGNGIGAALATGLAAEGAAVVVVDIDLDAASRVAAAIGSSAAAEECDVADPNDVEALAVRVFHRFGHLDLLFNNAGLLRIGMQWELSLDEWRRMFDVNVFGIVHAVRAFVPRMLAAGRGGHVVNTASVAVFNGGPCAGSYMASKSAAFALSESLAHDLALVGSDIKVSVVTPSTFATGIATAAPRDDSETSPIASSLARHFEARIAQGRPPVEAVRPILDGISRGQFLVATSPVLSDQLTNRFDALRNGRLPLPLASE
jgi:NAD(P)-dependent dehydrogenase (short-subunit alcohol dehydrogenase family)